MPYPTDRMAIGHCFVAACLACVAVAGCDDNAPDEYGTFSELQQSARSGDDSVADGTSDVKETADEHPDRSPSVVNEASAAEVANPAEIADRTTAGADSLTGESAADTNSTKSDTNATGGDVPGAEPEPPNVDLAAAKPKSPPTDLPVDEPTLAASADEPAQSHEIKLLVPEQTFQAEGPEGALRVSYDDVNLLTILNMEPVPLNPEVYFPDWLAGLSGQRIRIRGFMYPAFQATGLRSFVLVRDNAECCFGPGAKIYDHIQVFMRSGVTTDYIQGRPFDVAGVFRILPEADGDELYQLFMIEDAIVIEK